MSSPQPKYRYGSNTAEEEQTDEFLAKLTGSNKKTDATSADPKKSRESQPLAARSVNYSTLSDGRELPPKTSAVVCTYILGAISVIIFLASAAMMGFIAIKERPLAVLWPLAFYGAVALSGAGILGGVCGFAGTLCKSNALKSLCMFFVILFAIGCGAASAVTALYDTSNLHIAESWNEVIRSDPQTACAFMTSYECTGWSESCVATAAPDTPIPTTVAPASLVVKSEFDRASGRIAALGQPEPNVHAARNGRFYPGFFGQKEVPVGDAESSSNGGFTFQPISGGSATMSPPTPIPGATSTTTAIPPTPIPGATSTTTAIPGAASTTTATPGAASTTTATPGAASTTTAIPGAASTTAVPGTSAPLTPAPPTPLPPTPIPTTLAPPTPAPTPSPQCTPCTPDLTFTTPCATSFHSSLSTHAAIGLGAAGGLLLLAAIAAVAAYKSRSVIIDTRGVEDFF